MIVLGILVWLIAFAAIYYLVSLAIGLWVCLAYANPPWPVTRPVLSPTENVEGNK